MSAVAKTGITAGDRLSLTLFLSIAVHLLFVLGVGFTWALNRATRPPPMIEITLADSPRDKAPEDYDYLAQANQDGGGESEEKALPQAPQRAATPSPSDGRQTADAAPAPSDAAHPDHVPQITGNERPTTTTDTPAPEPEPETSAAQLIDSSRRVAASAEFAEAAEHISARYPSKRRISARTKAHAAAAYMREWVDKVESIGNLNYPEEARDRALSGRLILEVTVRPDGTVYGIKTLRPSPSPILDQAATRIVDLAAPFSRVPDKVLNGNDLLVITRTWEFDNSSQFSAN